MNKSQNILKDIENINRKIKKLEAQRNILEIQLESIKENVGTQDSYSSFNRSNNF